MTYARVLRTAFLAVVIPAAACTNYDQPPTAPTITTLAPEIKAVLNPPPQVAGLYAGTGSPWRFTGGNGPLWDAGTNECVKDAFDNATQSKVIDLVITQDATNISAITARMSSADTGLACTYTGTIGGSNGLALSLDPDAVTMCTGTTLLLRCRQDPVTLAEPPVRELQLVGSALTAQFDGWPANVSAVRGQAAQTYNIYDPNTSPRRAIAGFVATHEFTLTKQ